MATVGTLLGGKGSAIFAITPDAPVIDALREMADRNVGALLVLEGDTLVGILSERDYARKVILEGKSSRDTRVHEIMTDRVQFVTPKTTVDECLRLMTDRRIRHLPVLEAAVEDGASAGDTGAGAGASHLGLGRVVGVVSIGDVVKAKMDEQEVMIHHLEDYIAGNR